MPQKLKITWDIVQKIVSRDIDNDSVRMLLSTGGNRVHIPIDLYEDEEKVLSATVSLLPSQSYLYQPALAILNKKMHSHYVDVLWDHASFNGKEPVERSKLLCTDQLSLIARRACDQELADTFRTMQKEWKENDYGALPAKSISNLQFREFCAAIIGASAIVKSEDMERMIHQQSRGFWPRRFKPQGLEL